MPDITKADIEAVVQVLDSLGEQSDSLSRSEALQFRGELEVLHSVLLRTRSMVDTQCLHLLEQPVIHEGQRWVKARKFVRRFRHADIAKRVAERSVYDPETGEMYDARTAVALAVGRMQRIYCSDSTTAKVGELERILGVGDPEDEGLAYQQHVGSQIKAYPLEG